LYANRKRFTGPPHPDRDTQFEYLQAQKQDFLKSGLPVISVDTKKKELIGDFKNAGRTWSKEPDEVNAHDFRQDAEHIASPYGIYDLTYNTGLVYIGASADTSEFAVDAIEHWWKTEGRSRYPKADKLLILADAGGSNGCRFRLFKQKIQERLADLHALEVTLAHYPTGASKWNPVEHRLFGPISCNWQGIPLRSLDIMVRCIRGTKTTTGLHVDAFLTENKYEKGIRVSDREMKRINIQRHRVCPAWNYTIYLRLE
jgi:hypothetical protein